MGRWSVGNANALYRGERPRLHYKTKSNVQLAWRFSRWRGRGGRLLDGSRARRGRAETPETGSRDDAHSGEQCRPRKTRSGRNLTRWRRRRRRSEGRQKGHPPADTQGRVIRRVTSTSTHVTIQTLPASANLPRKVAPPLKRKGRLLEARGNRSPPRSESL